MSVREVAKILDELNRRKVENRIQYFQPYPFQKKFCCAKDEKNRLARQIMLQAANQVGKTFVGGNAVAIHATGLYPDWWTGRRFKDAPLIWVGGNTIPNTRDLCQSELLGEAGDEEAFGTGAVPKHLIGRITKYHGIPDAAQSVLIKHKSGKNSKIIFKAYEQGKEAWMGKGVHYVWCDEEVPYDVYSQCLRATVKFSGIVAITATPENGLTELVRAYNDEIKPMQALIRATWDDASHLDEETKEQILSGLLPHEREMRSKGIPVIGTGLIWPIAEEEIQCEPFAIPKDWTRIAGIDFAGAGSDGHPTALTCMAIDPESDTAYVYDTYSEAGRTIPEHWLAMKRIGNTPIAWPHDGMITDRSSGISYAEQYRREGANMLEKKFSNPPLPNMKEGSGGNAMKPGLTAIWAAMKEGRFKVFSNQTKWFDEFRQYYQKNGEVVKDNDDLMSATRYAFMSQRFATRPNAINSSYVPTSEAGYYDLTGY